MDTDPASSNRPKRQLVKAACQSCQRRKVKVGYPVISQGLSVGYNPNFKSTSVVENVLHARFVNKEAKSAPTILKRASQESRPSDAGTKN